MTIKPHWYQILLALAGGAGHGAEIRRSIRERSGGAVEIYPAMLYGSLEDLLELGYIKEQDDAADGPPGRRRCYVITGPGRRALAEETQRLEALTRAAREALGRP
jgi:DNA-binding PadR family transcriptional regulator